MTKRSFTKKILYIIGILFLLFILAGIVMVFYLLFEADDTNRSGVISPWEKSYYIFVIISSIGTLSAVIVALSKDMLLRWLNCPDLDITIQDGNIIPIYEENMSIPLSYECKLRILNKGGLAAINCEAFVNDVKYYNGNRRDKLKSINNACQRGKMKWYNENVNILTDIPVEILVFRIINPSQLGTPERVESSQQISRIEFNGCIVPNSRSTKGIWSLEYYISSSNGSVTRFQIMVEWTEGWSDKPDEMKDNIVIECKKI